MDRAAALAFLRAHPRTPGEEDMTEELHDQYGDLIQFLCAHPDEECLRLLVLSSGDDIGAFMGQGLLPPLEELDVQARNRVLLEALDQPDCGYWAANLAAAFPDPSFVPPLQRRLIHPDTDADTAGAVATALGAIEESQPGGPAGQVLEQDYHQNPRWAPIQAQEAQASKTADIVMRKMSFDRILPTAEEAFRARDYRRVVTLLAPYEDLLTGAPRAKLELARKKVG